MFKKLEGDTIMLSNKGVYTVTELYTYNGGLYAKVGSGFVRLRTNGTTSKTDVLIVTMETDIALYKDKLGRLATDDAPNAVKLSSESRATLLLSN
tara:strand:- start:265 stop:549 length:285 start_codon:yes stop_codon:yes gene_type:complete